MEAVNTVQKVDWTSSNEACLPQKIAMFMRQFSAPAGKNIIEHATEESWMTKLGFNQRNDKNTLDSIGQKMDLYQFDKIIHHELRDSLNKSQITFSCGVTMLEYAGDILVVCNEERHRITGHTFQTLRPLLLKNLLEFIKLNRLFADLGQGDEELKCAVGAVQRYDVATDGGLAGALAVVARSANPELKDNSIHFDDRLSTVDGVQKFAKDCALIADIYECPDVDSFKAYIACALPLNQPVITQFFDAQSVGDGFSYIQSHYPSWKIAKLKQVGFSQVATALEGVMARLRGANYSGASNHESISTRLKGLHCEKMEKAYIGHVISFVGISHADTIQALEKRVNKLTPPARCSCVIYGYRPSTHKALIQYQPPGSELIAKWVDVHGLFESSQELKRHEHDQPHEANLGGTLITLRRDVQASWWSW